MVLNLSVMSWIDKAPVPEPVFPACANRSNKLNSLIFVFSFIEYVKFI